MEDQNRGLGKTIRRAVNRIARGRYKSINLKKSIFHLKLIVPVRTPPGRGGGGGFHTLYSHLYEEVTPQGGTFFWL